jgi:hypothetical protein
MPLKWFRALPLRISCAAVAFVLSSAYLIFVGVMICIMAHNPDL